MKKNLLFPLALAILLAGCTKKDSTTNNNTTIVPSTIPAFTIQGLTNISFINNPGAFTTLYLTVQYGDSTQEMVSLSVSGLPAGVNMDSTWVSSGYPTYNTTLTIYDSTTAGATPGVYTATLTATGTVTGVKNFPFTITIKNPPPCNLELTGKYTNCISCNTTGNYADSVYADAVMPNKVWFTNFANNGSLVYGILSCTTGILTIPTQTVGGITYSSTNGTFGSHYIYISSLFVNGVNCYVQESL